MLMKTLSNKSCIVLAMAWESDRLKVTKYSSLSTACCILSEDLPLSKCKFLSCVDIASCTLLRHLDNPAAWLHITVCFLAALSHHLKMSWLRAREGGAAGKLRLATLLNTVFSFAGSGDQENTVEISVFLVCMHVILSR